MHDTSAHGKLQRCMRWPMPGPWRQPRSLGADGPAAAGRSEDHGTRRGPPSIPCRSTTECDILARLDSAQRTGQRAVRHTQKNWSLNLQQCQLLST